MDQSKTKLSKIKISKNKVAICQQWILSERGWGASFDGVSLHITEEQRAEYIRDHWKLLPKDVPDSYSRPSGNPETIFVTKGLYDLIKERSKHCFMPGYKTSSIPTYLISGQKVFGIKEDEAKYEKTGIEFKILNY